MDPTIDDLDVYEEPKQTEDEHHEVPEKPPEKKRRLTGKQKYQSISAHTAAAKDLVNSEWKKHGVDSSRPTVTSTATRRKHYSSNDIHITVSNEQRDPKTIISDIPADNTTKIHKSHHKMLLRDITFCKHCGYNPSRKPQTLKEPCPLQPKHSNVAQQLRRMLRGQHPKASLEFWPDGFPAVEKVQPINLDGA